MVPAEQQLVLRRRQLIASAEQIAQPLGGGVIEKEGQYIITLAPDTPRQDLYKGTNRSSLERIEIIYRPTRDDMLMYLGKIGKPLNRGFALFVGKLSFENGSHNATLQVEQLPGEWEVTVSATSPQLADAIVQSWLEGGIPDPDKYKGY